MWRVLTFELFTNTSIKDSLSTSITGPPSTLTRCIISLGLINLPYLLSLVLLQLSFKCVRVVIKVQVLELNFVYWFIQQYRWEFKLHSMLCCLKNCYSVQEEYLLDPFDYFELLHCWIVKYCFASCLHWQHLQCFIADWLVG